LEGFFEQGAAFAKRAVSEVLAVQVQQVESVVRQPTRAELRSGGALKNDAIGVARASDSAAIVSRVALRRPASTEAT
jgi:hypothetical protein